MARKFGYQWAVDTSEALLNGSFFMEMVGLGPIKSRHGSHSERKWLQHLLDLVNCGVLREIKDPRRVSRVFLRYFAISKTCSFSRSIFDDTLINALCKKPLSANLPPLEEIRFAISCFSKAQMLSEDMRHGFHQIPLPSRIENYVSFQCAGRVFTLKVLPMGFSWAPYFSQCLIWAIVLTILPQGYESMVEGRVHFLLMCGSEKLAKRKISALFLYGMIIFLWFQIEVDFSRSSFVNCNLAPSPHLKDVVLCGNTWNHLNLPARS